MPTNYVVAASLYLISRMLDAVDGFTARNHFNLNYLRKFRSINKEEKRKNKKVSRVKGREKNEKK